MPDRLRLLFGLASLAIIVGSGLLMTLFTLRQSSSQVSEKDFTLLTETVNQLVAERNATAALRTAPQNAPVLVESTALVAGLAINKADEKQLDGLPGIGKVRAEAILAARANGPFRDLDDVHARVPKIPLSVLQDIAPLIYFE